MDKAIETYKKVLRHHPEDQEVKDRVKELRDMSSSKARRKKSSRKRPLRTGYTTGTCAAAAAKGAAMTFLDVSPQTVEVELPLGTTATIHLCECGTKNGMAYCRVIKDAGDDPDVTHGAVIEAQCSHPLKTEP